MKLVKVFDTSSMPEAFFEDGSNLFDMVEIITDEHTRYTVGAFVKEAGPLMVGFDKNNVMFCMALDVWLIQNGALDGEEILIYHG